MGRADSARFLPALVVLAPALLLFGVGAASAPDTEVWPFAAPATPEKG